MASSTTTPYVVKAGDYLVKIASEHGTTVAAIWNHPDNAALRAKRGSPDILYAGDILFIPAEVVPASPASRPPDKPAPEVDETGAPWPYAEVKLPNPDDGLPNWCTREECQCHPRDDSDPVTRRIIFYDHDGRNLPRARCRILYEGRLLNLDAPFAEQDAGVTFEVPSNARQLLLEWAPENTPLGRPFPYRVRYYLDVDDGDGVRRRLNNLGFSRLRTLEENVCAFQAAYQLEVTGNPDDIAERLVRDYDGLQLEPVPNRDASAALQPPWVSEPTIVKTLFADSAETGGSLSAPGGQRSRGTASAVAAGQQASGAGAGATPAAAIANMTLTVKVRTPQGQPIHGAFVAIAFDFPFESQSARTVNGTATFRIPLNKFVVVAVLHHNHGPETAPGAPVLPAIVAGIVLVDGGGLAPRDRQTLLPWPFPLQRPRVLGAGMDVVDDSDPDDGVDDAHVLVTMVDAGNSMLTDMAQWFRDEGLNVVEEPGWDTRGAAWAPSGGMIHHTGPPVPFAVENLYPTPDGNLTNGRIKANFSVQPDGAVHVIAAGACNFASGTGNTTVVLTETRLNAAPSDTAARRGLPDVAGGNEHYINCEAVHLGNRSPMPDVQERAVISAYNALFRNLGWPSQRLIGHCEWTHRKIDPRWNGDDNRTPHLRGEIAKLE